MKLVFGTIEFLLTGIAIIFIWMSVVLYIRLLTSTYKFKSDRIVIYGFRIIPISSIKYTDVVGIKQINWREFILHILFTEPYGFSFHDMVMITTKHRMYKRVIIIPKNSDEFISELKAHIAK